MLIVLKSIMSYLKMIIKMVASFLSTGIRAIWLNGCYNPSWNPWIHERMKRQGNIYSFVGYYCRYMLFGFVVMMFYL